MSIASHRAEADPDRLRALVDQLAAQKPDVIIAITSPAVLALKQARLTIPVVFAFVPDPVGLGIVKSLARCDNFTGATYSEAVLGGKRLELLVDAIVGLTRVAVLWGPFLSRKCGRPRRSALRFQSHSCFVPTK